jgi:hypothetical protein
MDGRDGPGHWCVSPFELRYSLCMDRASVQPANFPDLLSTIFTAMFGELHHFSAAHYQRILRVLDSTTQQSWTERPAAATRGSRKHGPYPPLPGADQGSSPRSIDPITSYASPVPLTTGPNEAKQNVQDLQQPGIQQP